MKRNINNPNIIESIKGLAYDSKKGKIEYCHVHPDKNNYDTFYPYGSPVGHTW